jgi:hypothetical protein
MKLRTLSYISITLLLFGCKSKQPSINSFERVEVNTKHQTLEGINLQVNWPIASCDTLTDTIYKIDKKSGAEIRLYKDALNRLTAECETKDTVKITTYVDRVKEVYVKEVVELSWWQRTRAKYGIQIGAMGMALLFIIGFVIRKYIFSFLNKG